MYLTYKDAIFFYPDFNDTLDYTLLSNYKEVIFSNFIFDEFECKSIYENYKINNLFRGNRYKANNFNQELNLLPQSIQYLT